MNIATNKAPIATVKGFRGMYSRGIYDTCPPDHLTDCFNCAFLGKDQITIREPITDSSVLPNGRQVISYFIAEVFNIPACLLTLSKDGSFYNETIGPTLLTIRPEADDFVGINLFGRTYISFKKGGKALAGDVLYYFDGINFSPAAGFPPVFVPSTINTSTIVGNIDPGVHIIAVSFLTRTGFITPPNNNATWLIFADGGHSAHIAGLPIGPMGTVGRVLLVSKANQTELFFLPGGTINDNTTTSITINFYDTSLIESADYLNDVMPSLPSCSSLRFYKGRLVLIGQDNFPDNILASGVEDPETFDSTGKSTINIPVSRPLSLTDNSCRTGAIIRDVLYIFKPDGTFSTQDNGGDPDTWPVSITDITIGCYDTGISTFASNASAQDILDSCFVLHTSGLQFFNGSYSVIPFTYKIQSIWDRINKSTLFQCQITNSILKKRVYIAVTVSSSFPTQDFQPHSANYTILMMDYQDGLDPQSVKWSVWNSSVFTVDSIYKLSMENFNLILSEDNASSPIHQLSFCNGTNIIYKVIILDTSVQTQNLGIQYIQDKSQDSYFPINQYIIIPVVPNQEGIFTFNMLNLSVYGFGELKLGLFSKYRKGFVNLRSFELDAYNNQELQRLCNLVSENMYIFLQSGTSATASVQSFFQINKIDVFGNRTWNMRPALLQSS